MTTHPQCLNCGRTFGLHLADLDEREPVCVEWWPSTLEVTA